MVRKGSQNGEPTELGLLKELVDRERELEAQLIEARAEAERILDRARAEAEGIVEQARKERERRAAEDKKARAEQVRALAEERIAGFEELTRRLDALDEDRVKKVARAILGEIFPELESMFRGAR